MKPFYVYMLRCSDGSYYVGHTDDLQKRIDQHIDGTLGGYTATRRPIRVVFTCDFSTREQALERERQLKGWIRAKKEALIRGNWDKLRRLAIGRTSPSTSLRANGTVEAAAIRDTP